MLFCRRTDLLLCTLSGVKLKSLVNKSNKSNKSYSSMGQQNVLLRECVINSHVVEHIKDKLSQSHGLTTIQVLRAVISDVVMGWLLDHK